MRHGYVRADARGFLSAHVTGNFVLFAAALGRGLEPQDYLKLWTFPVFIVAVAAATIAYVRGTGAARKGRAASGLSRVLGLMAVLLAATAGLAFAPHSDALDIAIVLGVVVAMGLQNALHHFIPGAMTTVMTGTVMNTVARATRRVIGDNGEPSAGAQAVNPIYLMVVFAAGCLGAGCLVPWLGFRSLVLAAGAAVFLWFWERRLLRNSDGRQA